MTYNHCYTRNNITEKLIEFEYFSNAEVFELAAHLAICDNYKELETRLNLDNRFSFLICKN